MPEQEDYLGLSLSIQRALFDAVTPSLRAVFACFEGKTLHLYFFYDGEISEKDRDLAQCAGTEIITDFEEYMLENSIIRLDAPEKISCKGRLFYSRYESESKDAIAEDYRALSLSIQRALLGAVTSPLREVFASFEGKTIHLYFFYHGEISEKERDLAECAGTEVVSDFPEYMIENSITRLDAPEKISCKGRAVYSRYEGDQNMPLNHIRGVYNLRTVILMSLQRALLGEVSANLRSVKVDWDENKEKIDIFFYFDKEVTEDNRLSASCVAAEFSGDFGENTQIVEHCLHVDSPHKTSAHVAVAYERKE